MSDLSDHLDIKLVRKCPHCPKEFKDNIGHNEANHKTHVEACVLKSDKKNFKRLPGQQSILEFCNKNKTSKHNDESCSNYSGNYIKFGGDEQVASSYSPDADSYKACTNVDADQQTMQN